jgi:rhodanese-related sulfurtransferase
VDAARSVTAAGYENVLVITGGLAGWMSAGYAPDSGTPALKAAYAPKPRPGSLPVDEFRAIAADRPADTLILDVRNRDELKEGMIAGALNVPDEEVLARLAEIPRDKRIVTHCSTGVRAEMAYHKLKERGFARVAFLDADVDFENDGKLVVTPK